MLNKYEQRDGFTQSGTAYTISGEASKPTLVLIHGIGLQRDIWQEYFPLFSRDFQVLSYDLLGHGKSVLPSHPPSLTLFAEQLKELLDELSVTQVVLIGFSLGGMINRRFVLDHVADVRALVILNSPHERDEKQQQLIEKRARQTEQEGILNTLDATIERWFTKDFMRTNGDYIARIRQQLLANDLACYAACRRVLAEGVLELINPQPPLTLPVLIMTAQDDTGSTPQMAYAMGEEMVGSEVVIVPELKHMGLCEQPHKFAQPIMNFVKQTNRVVA